MNSRKTLTCNLFHLPQDIFRVIFQYLSVEDLMKGEEAFLNNQELLSLYRSSLEGFTLKEKIKIQKEDDELISWIIDRKLLVETLNLHYLNDLEMDLLNQIRSSLKSIHFWEIFPDSDNSTSVFDPLGHFPSLTSITFEDSQDVMNDELLSFFSDNPQLEILEIEGMSQLSNEILPHLSNSCPKIKILSLSDDWVNNETVSLLTEQRLFPNLMSLDLRGGNITNQESLRQFILSHPLLSSIYLPNVIDYSKDFLVFYLRQVIFPSILNNDNDFEFHALVISSLQYCFEHGILNEGNGMLNPEIFSVDILSHLYQKDCSLETLNYVTEIFFRLSELPFMIDSILQSQFIPFILNSLSQDELLHSGYLVDLLFRCGVFHDHFPLVVGKYQTHPNALIKIFYQAIKRHFPLLTTEELQTMISIVSKKLQSEGTAEYCLEIITKLLQEPSYQLLFDPNDLLLSLKLIDYVAFPSIGSVIECLKRFLSVNENYQQLFIQSNLLPQIMTRVGTYLIDLANHCLSLSRDGLLVDHLVNSGVFQHLLSDYSQWYAKNKIESVFNRLIKFKNNKYSERVREMKLPNKLRAKLFGKREEEKERRESLN